ncbi:M9 family metallopeptidase [Dokdonella sp.]|uniref:M9 family metallopeptidase n=1 Tax=Dokdonella sp. TaxID=2291710 RepID=UPI0025BD52D9|nr:M9 family metallopeptidase [Dokdonella sp.]
MSFTKRMLQAGVLAITCMSGIAMAKADARADYPAPQGATIDGSVGNRMPGHVQQRPLTPAELPPLPSTRDHLRVDYDRMPASIARPLGSCDVNAFATSSGGALVGAVKAATTDCINSLFSISASVGAQVFPESKMVTIANALAANSASYAGNNDSSTLQLILYLRAGYFLQWYNPAEIGDYGPTLTNAIRPALNAFVANSHFQDVNDNHGEVLSEFVTLIDSSAENASQLTAVRGILDRYDASWASYWYMKSAVNNVFTVLFRGHYNDDFRAAVQVAPGNAILDTLVNFINDNKTADLGSDREYLLQNAAGELARFLNGNTSSYGYPPAFHTVVHPKAKSILDQFSLGGSGAGIYVRMGGVIDYYDHAHCSYFNLCSFADDLEDYVLPAANARDCSPTLRVRSQALTPAQLDWVCARVGGEESFFHAAVQSNNVPVADDNNTRLEMVIFHSSTDYETYSGTIFGNDTNNGGIYLEGDPAAAGNQPRFLAYEAEWLRPTFDVWNLTHEYIHYLDGRFDWHGAFGDYPLDAPASAVWFIEGFAEYMSYSYRELVYGDAVDEAANPDKFTLAQLFDTEYSTDYARTYQWGYLAVRFMFEHHRDDITDLFVNVSRPGNYTPGYANWLSPIRSAYNAEFRTWLVCFVANDGDTSTCGGTPPQTDRIFVNGFDGDGTPPGGGVPECTDDDVRVLEDGCKRSGLSAASTNVDVWLLIYVPAGKTRLVLTMSGGTGDADMYQKAGGWPSPSTYDNAATQVGNNDTISVSNPAEGWHMILLKAKTSSFENVEVAADLQ